MKRAMLVLLLLALWSGAAYAQVVVASQIKATGSGTPNGSVTAGPGTLYLDNTGHHWLKVTGTGTSGWLELPPISLAGVITADITGTAAKATILSTTRAINGVNFDGSAPITVPVNNADDTTTAATMYPLWTPTVGGNYAAKVSSTKFTFNPSTGLVTATGFSGPLTGNVTGNVSGTSGSTTGNAATATALAATPAGCASNTYATSIAASGALGCASITNASTTAVSTATASTIVLRDGSGNFSATTITAALTGTASKATNIVGGNSTTLLGSLPYQSNTDATSLLAPNTTTTRKFLRMTGDGTNGTAPAWDTVTKTDVSLSNVENTALSTWAGTTNITTLGTISTGTVPLANVSGTAALAYLAGATAFTAGQTVYLDGLALTLKSAASGSQSGFIGWKNSSGAYRAYLGFESADENFYIDNPGSDIRMFAHNAIALTLGASQAATFTGNITAPSLTVDTSTLFVDATNHRVGIGTTNPGELLHVAGPIKWGTGTPTAISSSSVVALTNAANVFSGKFSANGNYTPTTGSTVGINIGFDANLEWGWIQATREDTSHLRAFYAQPLGGNFGVGPLGAIALFTTSGGVQVGSPTGGDRGAGTINLAGSYYSNGTIGTTCGSATIVSSTLGIVTACSIPGPDFYANLRPFVMQDMASLEARIAALEALLKEKK